MPSLFNLERKETVPKKEFKKNLGMIAHKNNR